MPSQSPPPLWTLRDVRVGDDRLPRLHIAALTIPPGTTVLVGPSGAGKSTLLDLLCGVITADAGEITTGDAVGTLFFGGSEGGLWPDETVASHLKLVGASDDAVAEQLATLELTDVAESRPAELSQGQRSRLSLARALAASPDTLLLDEPLAHVDGRRQHVIREMLGEWASVPGRSLVVATHLTDWVDSFDHAICLDEGRIAADAPTATLQSEPPSEAVAWSVGRPPVALLLCCIMVVAGLLSGCNRSDASIAVDPLRTYTMPPDGPRLPAPRGVTVDDAGRRFVLDNAGRVIVYSPDGDLLTQWPMPDSEIGKPEGIVVFPDGRVAVADTHYSRVVVFRPDGTVERMFGSRGSDDGQFLFPVAVERDDEGYLYVAEYGGNDRVQKFTADGQHVLTFGSHGTGPRQFQRASGLHVAGGKVWVADAINNRVHVWTTDGKFVAHLGEQAGLHWPYDLTCTPDGRILLPEYGSGTVAVLNADGSLAGRFGTIGREEGQFYTPWGLAIDADGAIIVADTGNHRLVEFRP